ncbi:MAG: substrate-binding domain-containing protein [Isosphaeraceae bacterium]
MTRSRCSRSIKTAFNGQQRSSASRTRRRRRGWRSSTRRAALWEIEPANRIASAMISERPEIKALLCCNDSMALGALAAVKAAGRAKQILIVGYDGISAVAEAIRAGDILATVDQHADQLAVYGIEFALKLIRGEAARRPDDPRRTGDGGEPQEALSRWTKPAPIPRALATRLQVQTLARPCSRSEGSARATRRRC